MKKLLKLLIVLVAVLILLPVTEENSDQPQSKFVSIHWGDLGVRLLETGVIDLEKFNEIYSARGGLRKGELELLSDKNNTELIITPENAGYILNLLWAFGLANKNEILEEGPMADPKFGGPEVFASTGGWILAKGDAMGHYSHHSFFVLTEAEQQLVERTAKNIFRPCCPNPAYFPDCNHGMAMLGLLELMAFQGFSEEEMYEAAETANSFWFPKTDRNDCAV